MKIQAATREIHGAEQSYRRFEPRIKDNNKIDEQTNLLKAGNQKRSDTAQLSTNDVLTSMEIDSLTILFDNQLKNNFSLYGGAKVQNIQSGALLDIRG